MVGEGFSSHAAFEPSPDRPDPVTLLERQAKTRVPELVPIRYGRMLVSPFTFYRGAALIMAHDLVTTPRSDIMYVVTEYGMVNLKGKSVPERAKAMISIAHPDFRDDLERHARANGLIPKSFV